MNRIIDNIGRVQTNNLERFRFIAGRMLVVLIALLLLVGGLVVNYSYLQLTHHNHYRTLSEDNRINIAPIEPARGTIFDRNQVPLANNRLIYNVELKPYLIDDVEKTIEKIQTWAEITAKQKKNSIEDLKTAIILTA